MDIEDHDAIAKAFHDAVDMAPAEVERWLGMEESRSVGWTHEGEHEAGRRIVEVKHRNKADLTDEDYAHMRKVVGYVHRDTAQRPHGDATDTRWRQSLMNWGHDPLKG